MGWIIIGIFVGVPALIFGGALISVKREAAEEKRREKQEEYRIYERLIQKTFTIEENGKTFKFEIKDMPQVSFERFLNLYNSAPEKWHIDRNQQGDLTCIPFYATVEEHVDKKGCKHFNTICIPLFWASAEDMMKYDYWADNDYLEGKTKGYERKRDAQLETLANYLQKDIDQRRKDLLAEYEKIVDKSAQVKVEGTPIILDLNAKTPTEQAHEFLQMYAATGGNN